jgi:transposase
MRVPIDTLALRDALQLASHRTVAERRSHRQHCVLMVAVGHSCREVADCFGDSLRSIERWVHDHAQKVPSDALDCSRGRPARLSPQQWLQLSAELERNGCAPGTLVWHGAALQGFLHRELGVDFGLRHCQRLLRQHRAQVAKLGAQAP